MHSDNVIRQHAQVMLWFRTITLLSGLGPRSRAKTLKEKDDEAGDDQNDNRCSVFITQISVILKRTPPRIVGVVINRHLRPNS